MVFEESEDATAHLLYLRVEDNVISWREMDAPDGRTYQLQSGTLCKRGSGEAKRPLFPKPQRARRRSKLPHAAAHRCIRSENPSDGSRKEEFEGNQQPWQHGRRQQGPAGSHRRPTLANDLFSPPPSARREPTPAPHIPVVAPRAQDRAQHPSPVKRVLKIRKLADPSESLYDLLVDASRPAVKCEVPTKGARENESAAQYDEMLELRELLFENEGYMDMAELTGEDYMADASVRPDGQSELNRTMRSKTAPAPVIPAMQELQPTGNREEVIAGPNRPSRAATVPSAPAPAPATNTADRLTAATASNLVALKEEHAFLKEAVKNKDRDAVCEATMNVRALLAHQAYLGRQLGRIPGVDAEIIQTAVAAAKKIEDALPLLEGTPTRDEAAEIRPFRASLTRVALFNFEEADACEDELPFQVGDIIEVLDSYEDNDWWHGKNLRTGATGLFPSNFTEWCT